MRRRRRPDDIVELLADAGFHARRRADGRVFASSGEGDQWLIVLATDRKDPYRTFNARDQVALCIAAAAANADPWLAWWPAREPVPKWIDVRRGATQRAAIP